MRALLSQNPNARSGDRGLDEILARFLDKGWRIDQVRAKSRDDAITEIKERSRDFEAVIAAGGDGTVNAVLQAALPNRLVVVVLPLGTANDFSRSLEIPEDPEDACAALLNGEVQEVDVATVNEIVFANAIGFGLGSKVTEELGSETKKRWGILGYPIAVCRAWRKTRPFMVKIDGPGVRERVRALQVTIANGRFYGGGMTVEDSSSMEDGVLDAQIIEPVPFRTLLLEARTLRQGRGWESPYVHAFGGTEFNVTTSQHLEVSVDGDLLTATPIHCKKIPGGLRVLRPKASH